MGGGGCVLLSRFARPRRSACFALIFLGPSHSKSRKEGVSSDGGGVLRQREGAQVWDTWRDLWAPYLRSPRLASWVCLSLQLRLRP